MKFVMTQAVCPEGMALLQGKADVYVADNGDPNNYLDAMADCDALIVRIAKCDASAIAGSPNLKVIGRTGVGYDSVDVAEATKRGIPVVITPGANNRSVAEHAVAMMFALSKNLVEAQNEMCAGNWKIRDAKKAFELEGKTVGVIGLGAIGRETAKICQGCGMKIAGYDPFLPQDKIEALGAACYADYEELLKVSDIVTIHVPLTDGTRNMIAKPQLDKMKKTSIIINCSRGGIINEEDLVQALKDGTIAGADYIITQMFFDNQVYYDFVDKCRKAGIEVPIIPGLKPLSSYKQLTSLPEAFSLDIPVDLTKAIEEVKENKAAIYQIGAEWCAMQCKDLIAYGVSAVHFYTMGKSENITNILKECF